MKTLMAIAILACSLQAEKKTHPLFDEMKKLEGHWVSDQKDHAADVTFKLSSGGSILMETMAMANHAEMITIYHPDGEDLALTHYCMLGNQPRMRAVKDQKTSTIQFAADGGTNMKPEDKHMHTMTITFVDADHIREDWALFDGGKEQTVVSIALSRK
ncbi:MAG TPA: hypothetical protein VKW04_09215 [Planctomycetota bacterium]|nr:hypothetical protein [Planctomycetota bacterium]